MLETHRRKGGVISVKGPETSEGVNLTCGGKSHREIVDWIRTHDTFLQKTGAKGVNEKKLKRIL